MWGEKDISSFFVRLLIFLFDYWMQKKKREKLIKKEHMNHEVNDAWFVTNKMLNA